MRRRRAGGSVRAARLLRLAGLAVVLAASAVACPGAPDGEEPGAGAESAAAGNGAGEPAPDLRLPDLEGNEVTLEQFRGKTVVIDFWATWCPPCVFQVPELNEVHAAHREADDLEILGVSVDVDGEEVVRPWAEEHDMQYRVLLGDEALAREFGAMGFPTLVVVTPHGSIDSLHVGVIESEELEEIVARVSAAAKGDGDEAGAAEGGGPDGAEGAGAGEAGSS